MMFRGQFIRILLKAVIRRICSTAFPGQLLRTLVRCALQSSLVPYRIKAQVYDKLVWAFSSTDIAQFNCRLAESSRITIAGPLGISEVTDIFWWGRYAYEPETFSLAWKLAEQSTCFFDVGANIGWYSLVARAANPRLLIRAFEPVPAVHAICRKNLVLNHFDDVVVEALAASDSDGTTELYIPSDTISSASLNVSFRPGSSKHIVKTITLDNYVKMNNLPLPDFIKLDTETTEPQILEGMRNILQQGNPRIICEVLSSADTTRLTAILKPLGYRFFFIVRDRLVEMPGVKRDDSIPWKPHQRTGYYNFLFSREDLV